MEAGGLNYPAIICRDMEQSMGFYRRLGMELLYMEPNRDDPESVQALLHAGRDTFLLLVGPVSKDVKIADSALGVGSMQYLSLRVSAAQMDAMFHEMSTSGVQGSEEIRRGYERLVFMEDPNGVLVTLTAWTADPPPGVSRAAALQRASALRDREGARYVDDNHLRAAIASFSA